MNNVNQPPHNPSPNTWAERVRVIDSSTRFTLDPIPRQLAGNMLQISEEILMDTAKQWNRCMIGFFPGFKMPYHPVNTIASRVWKHYDTSFTTQKVSIEASSTQAPLNEQYDAFSSPSPKTVRKKKGGRK